MTYTNRGSTVKHKIKELKAHVLTYTDKWLAVQHKIKELQAHLLTYTDRGSTVKQNQRAAITLVNIH